MLAMAASGSAEAIILPRESDSLLDVSPNKNSDDIRRNFVWKLYCVLSAQLALVLAISSPIHKASHDTSSQSIIVVFVFLVFVLLSMACCQRATRPCPTNIICLSLVTGVEAVVVGIWSTYFGYQSATVMLSMLIFVFVFMTVYTLASLRDFLGQAPYLAAGLAAMIAFAMAGVILMVVGETVVWVTLLYDLLVCIILSSYVVYDTQVMLGEWGGHHCHFSSDDHTFGVLCLHLDMVNVFGRMLSALGSRKE